MVHQHFQLIPVFTVAENVILGDELTKGPLLDIKEARRRIREIGEKYGLVVDPDAKVGDLSVGEQQRVELVKALFREAEILILDEPTAVLTPGEVDEFFGVVRTLVDQGKSIIFITHKLREVLAVADRITVLRGGKVVGPADPATATQQSLANLMVGRDVVFRVEKGEAKPGETVLSIEDLWVEDERGVQTVNDFTVDVRAGEIFGVAGVEGNGQRELVEAVAGMRRKVAGKVEILGQGRHRSSPARSPSSGPPTSRRTATSTAWSGPYSIADNLVLNRYHKAPFSKRGVRNQAAIHADARALVEQSTSGPRRRRPRQHAVGRQPAEGDRRQGAERRHRRADRRPNRPGVSTSGRSSSSTTRSSECAIAGPPCCWFRPSSTRSSRSRIASGCSTGAASWGSSTARPRPVSSWAT